MKYFTLALLVAVARAGDEDGDNKKDPNGVWSLRSTNTAKENSQI